MPTETFGYVFEMKVREFASEITRRFSNDEFATLVLILNSRGDVSSLSFDKPPSGWHNLTDELDANGVSYLFSDPFDPMEHHYLKWSIIHQPVMERMLGHLFCEADFLRVREHSQVPELPTPGHYPETWEVMF